MGRALLAGENSFGAGERLRLQGDFKKTYVARCRGSDGLLTVYACGNGLPFSRMGVSVGRRHGPAVVRNRKKRLLREAYRLSKRELPAGYDYILIPATGRDATLEQTMESLKQLGPEAAEKWCRKRRRGKT